MRPGPRRAIAALALAFPAIGMGAQPVDVESLWDYDDPATSEARFRESVAGSTGEARLELLTQVARTFSIRKRFDEAHRMLDEVEAALGRSGPRVRARYLLERGRAFNSALDKAKARPLFLEAWRVALAAREEGLAVDAAHMVAIVDSGTPSALEWNDRGLALARVSTDRKARSMVAPILNNKAWDLHSMKRYDEALALFEQAKVEWVARGGARNIQIANWSIARCLRSMGRHAEALEMQRALEEELARTGSRDRHVFSELAELHEALGRAEEAARYREKARQAS